MTIHSLQLAATPFDAIVSGNKTIESRLYDKKRQLIQLDDIVEFTNREAPEQQVPVRVIGLLRYPTFHDLFTHNDLAKFGGKDIEWLKNQISEFYSIDEQHENGVIGIEFELV